MLLRDTLSAAIRAIAVNRSRSLLTMLGIIIGVASVVLMVSIGKTFQNYILTQVESFGTNLMSVEPRGLQKFGGNLDAITYDDYEEIARLSTVESVVPVVLVNRTVSVGKEEVSPMVMGGTRDLFGNYGLRLARGRLLDDNDELGAKAIAVLGPKAAEDLFGSIDPIGKKVTVGESSLLVIGVLQSMGSFLLQDLDTLVFLPFSTARSLSGQKHLSFISLRSRGDPALAKQDITALMRSRHNIKNPESDPDKDDFTVDSAEQITGIVNSVTLGLTVFLALVAAISLLVGGIGIMNIMLVAVTERTREIGLRKAVGARRRDIMLQFLVEAVSLTLSGGLMGLVLGIFLGWFLTQIAAKFLGDLTFILSPMAVILALVMAVGTGLVFGLYPAKRAAGLSPMEALRYE